MQMMKYVWISRMMLMAVLLAASIRVLGTEKPYPFVISGQLKKVKQGKIYLMQHVSMVERFRNPGAYLHDSAVVVNGKFSFSGVIRNDVVPVFFTLQQPVSAAERAADPMAGYQTRYFYLTEGKFCVAGNSLDDMEISGNEAMRAFMKLDNSLKALRAESDDVFRKQLKVAGAADFPGRNDSIARYLSYADSLKKMQARIESEFIAGNPSALINVAILNARAKLAETNTAREIGELVAGLSPGLKKRPDMTAVAKRMKALSSLVPGNPALDFSLPDTAGKIISLSSLRGKYVLVEFWASWCGPCRMQIPYLKQSYAAFREKGFEILGVSLDEDRSKWLKGIRDEGLPWPQVSDLKGMESPVVGMYGITGIPLNYLLDTNGVIVARDLHGDALSAKLSELMSPREAPHTQGVLFDHALTWEQVKAKAKAENKYIFMDCYATWCAPCVKMIREVFPRKEMGDFFNDKFISIKLQLDKTDKDDDYVKMWYKDMEMIQATYRPPSMPTFLYFSPDGELVHRVPGSEDAAGLIAKSAQALNPATQYYTLVRKFERSGKNDAGMMKQLAEMSQQVMERENATAYADMYIATQTDLLTKENIVFLNRFSGSTTSKGFDVFLRNSARVNEVLGAGYAEERVRQVIFHEVLMPALMQSEGKAPDWKALQKVLSAKYPGHAEAVVGKYRAQYELSRGDWPAFQRSVMAFMQKYGNDEIDRGALLVFSRAVLDNIPDKQCVAAALNWSRKALSLDSSNLECRQVYAGLLYKSGDRAAAITEMEKAVSGASGDEKESWSVMLEKMHRGAPTWKN